MDVKNLFRKKSLAIQNIVNIISNKMQPCSSSSSQKLLIDGLSAKPTLLQLDEIKTSLSQIELVARHYMR